MIEGRVGFSLGLPKDSKFGGLVEYSKGFSLGNPFWSIIWTGSHEVEFSGDRMSNYVFY
jgi:hypothetical protein